MLLSLFSVWKAEIVSGSVIAAATACSPVPTSVTPLQRIDIVGWLAICEETARGASPSIEPAGYMMPTLTLFCSCWRHADVQRPCCCALADCKLSLRYKVL